MFSWEDTYLPYNPGAPFELSILKAYGFMQISLKENPC
jgi:hypothetical protein